MLWFGRSKEKRHGMLLDGRLDDPLPCRNCDGACCRAFPTVELSWDEYERLLALGATRLHFPLAGSPKLMIENGCEFLAGGRCSIYEHRPEICRRFTCDK